MLKIFRQEAKLSRITCSHCGKPIGALEEYATVNFRKVHLLCYPAAFKAKQEEDMQILLSGLSAAGLDNFEEV